MPEWIAFPYAGEYRFDGEDVRKNWQRLHAGDAEPLPEDAAVLEGWALFHNGEFRQATLAGLKAGGAGVTVANKATCIYANYLEQKEKVKLELFMEVSERAGALAAADPGNASAFYWQAYALGRYSQGVSVAKALALGLGNRIKAALERAIVLNPRHADAHIALGAFHAEVIDKVGSLIGGMTYGAKKETGMKLLQEALRLNPHSAIAMIEFANGMVMLDGDGRLDEATRLYERAAAMLPIDAMERLDVEMARAELQE